MKKIYMILAAISLLTLSLNAQMATTKKRMAQPKASSEKVDFALSGLKTAPIFAGYRAPSRATETTTVTFTAGTDAAAARTITKDGVTITNTQSQTSNNSFNYNPYRFYAGTVTFSTASGNITNIVITGSSTTNPTTRLSGTGYSSSNNVGTWTGSASSVTLTASGQVRVSRIVVTVETETGGDEETEDLTVCNGQYYAQYLPVFGYYHDEAQHNQMIYPASMLTDMIGKTIKSMTFYPTSGSVTWSGGTTESASGINFRNGSVCFKLACISSGSSFDADNPSFVTATLTEVSTINMPSTANTSATTWLITFSQDFKYTGGDLLIDVTNPTTGNWGLTFFTVDDTGDNYYGYLTSGAGNVALNYLPKVTFTYEKESEPKHDLAIALSAPTKAGAGSTVTVTATVTNTGDFEENGYTVTFTDGTNTVTQTATQPLAIGAEATFTAQFPTNANAGGQSVNFTATVACTDDAVAANNSATASTALITLPPPENVQATTGDNQSATMTWDAPTITPATINEGFDDTSEFPSFSIGGITASVHTGTIGGWTVYTPSGDYVYSPQNGSYTNMRVPQAWTVMNPTAANWNIDTPHSGSQLMLSFCDSGDENFQNIQTTDHWLISPELSGTAQTITFWERVITTQYGNETYEVLASSTDNDPSHFSVVQSITSDQTTWTQRSVTLPAGTKYFAIRHTSYDIFGVMIDDVTYVAAPIEPISYNIYLDGVLVGNVPSNTNPLSYTFNNLSLGEHQCAVSAVYDGGFESVAVPATFTIQNKTASPDITYVTTDATVVITATADDPTAAVSMTVNGETVTGVGSVSYTINRGSTDQIANVSATAQESGKEVSDPATDQITVPALPQTDAPNITWERVGDNIVITATGNGTVTLNVPGYPQATGTGSASVTVPCGADTQTLTVTATAQETNHLVSPTTTETVEIPYLITATPTINTTPGDDAVTITATGDGTVHMYVDGVEVTQPYEAPRQMNDYTITVTATAQESGKHISETATEVITIPGRMTTEGWLLMTGTYSGHQSLSFVDSLTNKQIMFADSISAMTFDNRHPDHYDYIIEEEGNNKTSNLVSIPVQKTYSTMYGLYTKEEVDGDTKRTLTVNSPNTTMVFDINSADKILYNYSLYRSEPNSQFEPIDPVETQPISKIHYNPSTNKFNEIQPYDVLPELSDIGEGIVKRVDHYFTDPVGEPGYFVNYVPVIWTMGSETGRTDGKNNSYGSDIKRSTLGDVQISIYVEKSDYTTTVNGETVQPGVWPYQGTPYTVFTPKLTITGTPPAKYVANDGDTIVYVPYMFRAWCLYEHPHDFARNSETELLEDRDEIPADDLPLLLGTVMTDQDTCTIGGLWTYGMDRLPWAFGAPVSTQPQDLTFAVRFYYKAVVKDSGRPLFRAANRDGEEEIAEGYIVVEASDNPDQIPTGLDELMNAGRVPVSTTYVNSVGMQSDRPFDGLNIVITRYSDGTTSTVKVMK